MPGSEDAARAEALADRLILRLTSVEVGLRPGAAGRLFELLEIPTAVDVLQALVARREAGVQPATETLAAVVECLWSLGETETVSALYEEARRRNVTAACRLLMRPPAQRIYNPLEEQGVDRQMRDVALGRRKALARGRDPVVLGRLMRDPDPQVIRNLLANPRLTEDEVVRIAATRPAKGTVLAEIFLNRRWGVRQRVRRALVRNPYTPTALGLKLVQILPLTDVREVMRDGKLHEELRRAAGDRVREARRRREIAKAAANLADVEPLGDA